MPALDGLTFPLSGHRLIEASAGTGKTYTISSLYLRLLLGRDPEQPRPLLASEILVLTFTIAATDELRERIRQRVNLARAMFAIAGNSDASFLESANSNDDFIRSLISESHDIEADRRLLTAALQTMDEASIFTIHGFCARILAEQSFDAGMLFNMNLDGDKNQLMQTACEDCFRQEIMSLPDRVRDIALKQFPNPKQLANLTGRFLFRHNLSYLPAEQDIGNELDQLILDNQRCQSMWLSDNISQVIQEANFKGNSKAVMRLKPTSSTFIEDYCASNELNPEAWLPWSSLELDKAAKTKGTIRPEHEIFDLIDSIVDRQHLIALYTSNLCHTVVKNLKQNLEQSKTRLSQLTLDDLLVEVHRALTEPGSPLPSVLKQKWPVAMIDEFQDTDDLQAEIFTQIYPKNAKHSTLLFIGDPKQAIYNFRGADVYTYINAKQSTQSAYSLGTNWRSTPEMIAAVNHLFSKQNIFGNDSLIPFEPVAAAEKTRKSGIVIDGKPAAAMPVFVVNQSNAEQYIPSLMDYAAEETVRLLSLAQQKRATINEQPIKPGQIAFLVRQSRDARAARKALAVRNIKSVYVTLDSVLLTQTAQDLYRILEAVIEPTNEQAIKSALATNLMQCTVTDISGLNQDWSNLHDVMEEFQQYHQVWSSLDIAPMLEGLMSQRQLAEKWLLHPDGERQLTNLRHLTEILQARSMTAPGMRRLLKWFKTEQIDAENMAADDQQLRLESDSNLVQIVTMHASKGLEYDIVMIPYAGFGEPRGKDAMPLFHMLDSNNTFIPAIDFSGSQTSNDTAKREDFDESMRLMYVAMTRARYRCYIGLPLSKKLDQTPIAKLLDISSTTQDDVNLSLEQLPSNLFEVTWVEQIEVTQHHADVDANVLVPALLSPSTKTHWRVHSYTGLMRLLIKDETLDQNSSESQDEANQLQIEVAETGLGIGDDEQQPSSQANDGGDDNPTASRFNFLRGPRVGIVLHEFMENLDFSADVSVVSQQATRSLAKLGQEDPDLEWNQLLCTWFEDIVHTPMSIDPQSSRSFTLNQIARSDRLDEMEFHFPIAADQSLIQSLQAAHVLTPQTQLKVDELTGMMTGYIDLIVRHDGKFYLIDYKSNDLGPTQASYQNSALTDAVKHHQYDLQYLIYCVALNRHLAHRVPDYSYAEHFGGVYYLFLRGMNQEAGNGVYADLPDHDLIQTLDKVLADKLPKPRRNS